MSQSHPMQMLTPHQVSDEFRLTLRQIITLIESEMLPCYRLGDFGERVRFLRCQVEAVVKPHHAEERSLVTAMVELS